MNFVTKLCNWSYTYTYIVYTDVKDDYATKYDYNVEVTALFFVLSSSDFLEDVQREAICNITDVGLPPWAISRALRMWLLI